jgi:hypothetical protein
MKYYFEKNEEENFESMNSIFYSHRESGFKNPKISGSRRIEFEKNQRLKKSKIYEVEVLRLNPSLQLELSLGGY